VPVLIACLLPAEPQGEKMGKREKLGGVERCWIPRVSESPMIKRLFFLVGYSTTKKTVLDAHDLGDNNSTVWHLFNIGT
jgi:hypothetical protein